MLLKRFERRDTGSAPRRTGRRAGRRVSAEEQHRAGHLSSRSRMAQHGFPGLGLARGRAFCRLSLRPRRSARRPRALSRGSHSRRGVPRSRQRLSDLSVPPAGWRPPSAADGRAVRRERRTRRHRRGHAGRRLRRGHERRRGAALVAAPPLRPRGRRRARRRASLVARTARRGRGGDRAGRVRRPRTERRRRDDQGDPRAARRSRASCSSTRVPPIATGEKRSGSIPWRATSLARSACRPALGRRCRRSCSTRRRSSPTAAPASPRAFRCSRFISLGARMPASIPDRGANGRVKACLQRPAKRAEISSEIDHCVTRRYRPVPWYSGGRRRLA